MQRSKRYPVSLEALEGRAVLSGIGGTPPVTAPSLAVQADLAKIHQDQLAFQSVATSLGPTIQKDAQAIQAAVAASKGVQAAEAAFQTDVKTWLTTLHNDQLAISSATTTAARTAAITQFRNDAQSGVQTLQSDQQAIHTAVTTDPGVQAAQTQLKNDLAPLFSAQATLQADVTQLQKDVQAQSGSTTGSGTA